MPEPIRPQPSTPTFLISIFLTSFAADYADKRRSNHFTTETRRHGAQQKIVIPNSHAERVRERDLTMGCATSAVYRIECRAGLVRGKLSRFLTEAGHNLLPRDDIGRVLLVPADSVIKLGALGVGQRCRVRFQALPHRIKQFRFLGSG